MWVTQTGQYANFPQPGVDRMQTAVKPKTNAAFELSRRFMLRMKPTLLHLPAENRAL